MVGGGDRKCARSACSLLGGGENDWDGPMQIGGGSIWGLRQ